MLHHGRIVSARPQFFILNDQAISLILGLAVSILLIWHPGGFLRDEYNEMQNLIRKRETGPIRDLTLFFEVLIMPPIIYESGLTLYHNVRVISRMGTLCLF